MITKWFGQRQTSQVIVILIHIGHLDVLLSQHGNTMKATYLNILVSTLNRKKKDEINFNDAFYLTPYSQNYCFNIIDR